MLRKGGLPIYAEKIGLSILPRAELPRDLDIVVLPPGTFLHQNRAFFLFGIFPMYIKQISIAFIPTLDAKFLKTNIASLLNVKCKIHRSISCGR